MQQSCESNTAIQQTCSLICNINQMAEKWPEIKRKEKSWYPSIKGMTKYLAADNFHHLTLCIILLHNPSWKLEGACNATILQCVSVCRLCVYLGLKDWHGCLLSLWLCVHIHGVRSLILCTSENQTHKIELLVSQLGHHTKYSAVISLKNSTEYNTITFHNKNNELKSTGQLFSVVQHHTIECWLLPKCPVSAEQDPMSCLWIWHSLSVSLSSCSMAELQQAAILIWTKQW